MGLLEGRPRNGFFLPLTSSSFLRWSPVDAAPGVSQLGHVSSASVSRPRPQGDARLWLALLTLPRHRCRNDWVDVPRFQCSRVGKRWATWTGPTTSSSLTAQWINSTRAPREAFGEKVDRRNGKLPEEAAPDVAEVVRMDPDVRERVDAMWRELGLL